MFAEHIKDKVRSGLPVWVEYQDENYLIGRQEGFCVFTCIKHGHFPGTCLDIVGQGKLKMYEASRAR